MTSEGLGEMFEVDSTDMCAGKFPLVSMVGQAEGLACADPGSRTPIGTSGNLGLFFFFLFFSPREHSFALPPSDMCAEKILIFRYIYLLVKTKRAQNHLKWPIKFSLVSMGG